MSFQGQKLHRCITNLHSLDLIVHYYNTTNTQPYILALLLYMIISHFILAMIICTLHVQSHALLHLCIDCSIDRPFIHYLWASLVNQGSAHSVYSSTKQPARYKQSLPCMHATFTMRLE